MMRSVQEIKLIYETGEELLPGFLQDFPYIVHPVQNWKSTLSQPYLGIGIVR